jgi:hypothetical protein
VVKFLIDECLSLDLVAVARDRGYVESSHVVTRISPCPAFHTGDLRLFPGGTYPPALFPSGDERALIGAADLPVILLRGSNQGRGSESSIL